MVSSRPTFQSRRSDSSEGGRIASLESKARSQRCEDGQSDVHVADGGLVERANTGISVLVLHRRRRMKIMAGLGSNSRTCAWALCHGTEDGEGRLKKRPRLK